MDRQKLTSVDRQLYAVDRILLFCKMIDDRLTGYLTRPEAARAYNRSQRALERDLDNALRATDLQTLEHWKLITKDNELRDASAVNIELVKELQADGQNPVWYVQESFLLERFGRKGEPKPRRENERKNLEQERKEGSDVPDLRVEPAIEGGSEIDFLKERIRNLEREKQQEIERSEKREAKLFAQLEVKDRQISAWDELTQGLTRGLATGQLRPNELSSPMATANHPEGEFVEAKEVKKSPSKVKGSAAKRKSQPQTKRDEAQTKKKPSKSKTSPPKWYEMPTVNRIFGR